MTEVGVTPRVSIAWLWLAVRLAIAGLALLTPLAGCAWRYPPGSGRVTQETPAPTREQLAALIAVSPDHDRLSDGTFVLLVYPAVVLAGHAARVTCFVPRSYGRGRIRIALEGIRASDHPLDRIETQLLIARVPCGVWLASCVVRSARGLDRREQKIEGRGAGCEDAP